MMSKTAGFASVTIIGIRATQTADLRAWTVGIDRSAISFSIDLSQNAKSGSDGEPGTRDAWRRTRWQDPSWSQQIGGLTGILGRAPAHLILRSQQLANYEAARCNSFSRNRACLAGEGPSREARCQEQELLWRQFFLDPTLWCDNRQHKKSSRWPDFRHKESHEVLWVNNFYKPAWVDEQLAALDMQIASTSKSSLPDKPDPGRPAEYGMGVTAATVNELCQQGKLIEAVEALEVLAQTDPVSKSLLYTLLKHCVSQKDLVLGRRVHALTVKMGYESDTFLSNHILRMYASHARLQEAMDVFTLVARPDAFMWSSIISAHVNHGQPKQAIQLYHKMRSSSVKPDNHVFVAALKACARGADLEAGQQVHADVLATEVEPGLQVVNCLVDMYAKCGSLNDAQKVFHGLGQKDVVTWTSMIAGYSQQTMGEEALHLYSAMQEEGITIPNSVTFVCLLQACASVGTLALEKGKQLHAHIRERGLEADVVVGGSLVNMYAKCGRLQDAQSVFDRLPQKSVVTWTAMIAGYAQQGMGQEALHVYSAMQEEGITIPNSITFVCLLQACASVGTLDLEKGKQLHAQIRERRLEADVVVGGSLVNMYAKCGRLQDAQSMFDRLPQKSVVTWSAMIAGYSQQGRGQEALHLYSGMQEEGIAILDSVSFVCLLQACASVGTQALEKGKQLHAQIGERGLESDVVVGGSLVNMYAKCGSLEDAQSVFDRLPEKNMVTWNAMIAGYSQQGMGQEALHIYSAMQQQSSAVPDSVTFVCLLQACARVAALNTGRELHAQLEKQGLQSDVVVATCLINMYAKCGSLDDAQSVFDGLRQKDVVTWNAMIAGYSQEGMGQEALHLYSAMQEEGNASPNSVTFVCLLQACASVGKMALEKGNQLHAQIEERGLQSDVFVANSLINMYAKCGSLEDAQRLFDGLRQKDVVTWNALIAGYSQEGMGQEALHLYSAMQEDGIASPDSVTFVCLLQACANVAALHPGRHLHAQIVKQGLEADVSVANSLINMYAKSGSVVDAQQVFDALPQRDIVAWNALIAGYTCQGDSEVVFSLIQRMKEDAIQPNSVTFLSVLTVCSHAGLVNKGREYFEAMSRHHGITPTLEHYTGMVDLLGRAGKLDEALEVVGTMPVKPNHVVWHALLGACRKWSNVEVGRHAFDEAVKLNEMDAAAYVMMCNIYTGAKMWQEAQEMQARRIQIGAWKQPGQSWWIDMSGIVHAFLVGDRKHPESVGIYTT